MIKRIMTLLSALALMAGVGLATADTASAATGRTCKTVLYHTGGNSFTVGALCVTWDDSPAGSAYRVTKRELWNDSGHTWASANTWANNGHYVAYTNIVDQETETSLYISTGTASTKAQLNTQWGTFCVYVAPNTGSYAPGACSV